jgi:dTDP-4-amino-4,6-dideoxygalactose transaminase
MSIKDLAAFGGPPQFCAPLHVGAPNVGDRHALMARIEAMLDRNWLTNDGPLVKEFEERICDITGATHAVVVANGTLGLQLMAAAAELTGEIVVPSYTFIATAHALRFQGLRPVFCDVDRQTHTVDPAAAASAITERTSAIFGVHLWGNVCDVDALDAVARSQDIDVFYDAAHAFGCGRSDAMVGRFGRAEVFSFHATKFINSFEGGAVTTDDGDLAERLRLLRNFGFAGYDSVQYLGTNAKMTEVCAAMGLTSLDNMDAVIERNRANLDAYRRALCGVPGVHVVEPLDQVAHNFQYVVIEIDPQIAGIDRDQVVAALWAENVRARKYFAPGCHRSEPYASENSSTQTLAVTEELSDWVAVLPTGLSVTPDMASSVGDLVRSMVGRAADLHALASSSVDSALT